ncbi:terminase, partial [Vibrio parahaemolyticus]|nr:terminase [Vibrio parahaemolyticus]
LKACTPREIATELKLNNERIIYYWADKYGWRDMLREQTIVESIANRIQTLLELENPSKNQLDMLDRLIKHHTALKKMRAQDKQKGEQPVAEKIRSNESVHQRSNTDPSKKKKKRKKNDISELTEEQFATWHDSLFEYQHVMRKNIKQRIRNILKSRQIGATYYFSGEALEDAILTGDNQIFLSASR